MPSALVRLSRRACPAGPPAQPGEAALCQQGGVRRGGGADRPILQPAAPAAGRCSVAGGRPRGRAVHNGAGEVGSACWHQACRSPSPCLPAKAPACPAPLGVLSLRPNLPAGPPPRSATCRAESWWSNGWLSRAPAPARLPPPLALALRGSRPAGGRSQAASAAASRSSSFLRGRYAAWLTPTCTAPARRAPPWPAWAAAALRAAARAGC